MPPAHRSRIGFRRIQNGDIYEAILITGHIPTRFMDDNPKPDYIWRDREHWHMDCGCDYDGQLGAVCLETGEEFYT